MALVVRGPASDPHRMLKYGSVEDVGRVIKRALRDVGVETMEVSWSWSSRFTSRMGDAELRSCVLRFSRPLWPNASPAERKETIVHEACHLAAYDIFGEEADAYPHGSAWRVTMERAGYPDPAPYHHVSRAGVASVARGLCRCRSWEISLAKARRHMNGRTTLSCSKCKGALMFALEDL